MKIPNEKIVVAYKSLPEAIRGVLSDESFARNIQTIASKYNLHVDMQGELVQMVSYILLGFLAPEDFRSEMIRTGISDEQASQIIKDVNEKVFLPLQQEMKQHKQDVSSKETDGASIIAQKMNVPEQKPAHSFSTVINPASAPTPFSVPVSMPAPVAAAPVPPPIPVSAPAPFAPPKPFSSPVPIPPPPPPVPVHVSVPIPVPMPAPVSVFPDPHYEVPAIRTMAHDMQEMKEGHMPARQPMTFAAAPQSMPMSVQPAASPARSFQTSSVPSTMQPVPVAPIPRIAPESLQVPAIVPVPPAPAHSFQTMPRPAVPVPPNLPGQNAAPHPFSAPAAASAGTPILKEYGVDPYRETPE